MKKIFATFRRAHPALFGGAGLALMVLSGFLILAHVKTIMEVRDVSVPIIGQLPVLERRLRALTEQIDITQMSAAMRTGSQQEKIEVYALPKETDMSRTIATFEIIREVLTRDGLLATMSDIRIGESSLQETGGTAQTLSVDFAIHDDGVKTIILLMRLAGLLTVGDALTEDEIALLVDRVEQENPSGIIALEQFLSSDLLQYAKDPKAYEEQLNRSFGSTTFSNAFENVLRVSLLRDVRTILRSDLGEILQGYKLWPLQMMTIDRLSMTPGSAPGWQNMNLTVSVYSAEA